MEKLSSLLGLPLPFLGQKPPRYLVTINTPKGVGEMEVPSFLGPEAASRRAVMTAAASGWGDLPDLYVISTTLIPEC